MLQVSPINFGLIIAYFLPGSLAVFGLRYVSGSLSELFQSAQATPINVGAIVILVTASLIAGLIISSFGVIVIENIHYRTGVTKLVPDYSKLVGDKLKLYKDMVENVYRYHQFYGNMMTALLVLFILRYLVAGLPVIDTRQHFSIFMLVIITIVFLFFSSRKSLSDVCTAVDNICR
jgi:hypothetical protein